MDAFTLELMDRSPLAAAALELADFAFEDELLGALFNEHRGRCYESRLTFPELVRLIRSTLLEHDGSAHRLFLDLERDDSHPVDESNFYRKLAKTPAPLSQALLASCTQRLQSLMVRGGDDFVPTCFDRFAVIAGDGKKVKRVAKRLLPTRGVSGALLGATSLAGLDLRTGLVLAMSTNLDGVANDVPMVPGLVEQLRSVVPESMLTVWDRQFGDVATMRLLMERDDDSFVVRVRKNLAFKGETKFKTVDHSGRAVIDEVGTMSARGKGELRVRRITLQRADDEDSVIIVTNLLDDQTYSAADLLALYRKRWGIEQVFQQVTETFGLSKLIGCAPKAVLLQLSICFLLYNLMQVIRCQVAATEKVKTSEVSMAYLFDHTHRQMLAWAYHGNGAWPHAPRDEATMQRRLAKLLTDAFDIRAYAKQPDRKPRPKRPPPQSIHGGYTSVQRLMDAAKTPPEALP